MSIPDREGQNVVQQIESCARQVYAELGTGFSEVVYHNAMELELARAGMYYETHRRIPVMYKDYCVGSVEADLVVRTPQTRCIVELKATTYEPRAGEHAQIRAYMRLWAASHDPTIAIQGLLVNFRQPTNSCPDPALGFEVIDATPPHPVALHP